MLLLLILGLASCAGPRIFHATPKDPTMSDSIIKLIKAAEAQDGVRVGFLYRDPVTDTNVAHREHELFHSASTMKTAVMLEVFRQAEAGRFSMQDTMIVDPWCESMIDGSKFECDSREVLQAQMGKPVTLMLLAEQMMVVSDNLATNMLLTRVAPREVTHTLRELGARDGFILRGVQDEEAYKAGLNNRLSAHDLVTLLQAIEEGRAAGPGATAEMRRILLAQEFRDMIPAMLPEGVRVGHKTGSITGIRHDSGIVYMPDGSVFYLAVMTEGMSTDTARALVAELAFLCYQRHKALGGGLF